MIGWLGVDPDYHGKGIGRALVEKVERVIKKLGGTEIWVETPSKKEGIGSDYEKTYKFYEAMGFQEDSIKMETDPETGKKFEMANLKKALK